MTDTSPIIAEKQNDTVVTDESVTTHIGNRKLNPKTGKRVQNLRASTVGKHLGDHVTFANSKRTYYVWPHVKPIIEAIDPKKPSQERIWLILTKLYQKNGFEKHRNEENDQPPVAYYTCADLEKIGGRKYNKFLNALMKYELISPTDLGDNKYKCRLIGYQLSDTFFDTEKRKQVVIYQTTEQSLSRYYRVKAQKLDPLELKMFAKLKHYEIAITKEQFTEEMKKKYMRYKERFQLKKKYCKHYVEKSPKSLAEYVKIQLSGGWNMIDSWQQCPHEDRIEFFRHDDFGNRLFTIFSAIPSEIRRYITTKNGTPIDCSIDLATSQFTILADLAVKSGIVGGAFVEDVVSGQYYERRAERLGIIGEDSRAVAKIRSLEEIYGDIEGEGHKRFCKDYPEVGAWITENKSKSRNWGNIRSKKIIKRNANLAQDIQKAESRIFRKIWERLNNEQIEYLSIHDSIEMNNKDKERVRKIMEEEITGSIRIQHKLK